MENVLYNFYLFFIETLQASDILFISAADFLWPTLILGFFCCFFGFKLYRVMLFAATFMGLAILTCLLLQNRMEWGMVVAVFTVLGGILSFAAFFWRKIGAISIAALWGFVLGQFFLPDLWMATIAAAVFGVLAFFFTFDVVVISSTLVGSIILGFFGASFIPSINLISEQFSATLGLVIFGCLFQYLTNRKQKTIPRRMISLYQKK